MSGWRVVSFEPLDVVACADGRNLEDGGYGHLAEISPLTMAGALRAAILRQAGFDFSKKTSQQASGKPKNAARWVGTVAPPEAFRFAGPQILEGAFQQLLFPAPRLFCNGAEGDPIRGVLAPARGEGPLTDSRFGALSILEAPGGDDPLDSAEGWVEAEGLATLLLRSARRGKAGGVPGARFRIGEEVGVRSSLGEFADTERRHGHERETGSGAAAEGQLFSRGLHRFRDEARGDSLSSWAFGGLLADVPDDAFPAGPFDAPLGGDGHRARVSVLGEDDSAALLEPLTGMVGELKDALQTLRGVIFYLATPAVFPGGWRPNDPPFKGLTLRAAAVGRPRIVAGWDAEQRRPRPVYRAVPAGSVYLYSLSEDVEIEDLIKRFHGNESLCEVYPKLGFGPTFLGVWDARVFGTTSTSSPLPDGGTP